MHPVDTYLKRVAFWLPARNRRDILDELRDAIELRIDRGSRELGRDLTDSEVALLLREVGHPATVTARYVRQRPVISGMLAFFYWRVLAIGLVAVVAAQALLLVVEIIRDGVSAAAVVAALSRTVVAGLLGFACITTSFVILDRRYGEPEDRIV